MVIPIDMLDIESEVVDGPGSLAVLNCGVGDMKFSFDSAKPAEVERAKGVIEDMLRRGYILMIEEGGTWHRVKTFDAARCEYVILDNATEVPAAETEVVSTEEPKRKRRGRPRGVPAKSVRAVSVAPTSGG